ncbi:MAG: hypothetical protein AAF957_08890 [Planctomycetota bacterium]
MTGDDENTLDQTIELRGSVLDLRAAIIDAGGDGSVDVIPLGGHDALIRFYGDVRLELDLALLTKIDVSIWAGFEGGGLAYAIGTQDGIGSPRGLESGYSLALDPIGYANVGLLDEPLEVHAYHRIGRRTKTTLMRRASSGSLVLYQDV